MKKSIISLVFAGAAVVAAESSMAATSNTNIYDAAIVAEANPATVMATLADDATVTMSTKEISSAEYVNPFIGTSNYGTTQPGPVVPQGMVSMSPYNTIEMPGHTINTDAGWCSTPYVYENKYCAGFTNVNLSGVGCPDYGTLIIMPTTGEIKPDSKEYSSPLKNQKASAGYYSAILEKYNIFAEMTATERTSRSRYRFPAGKSNILFNIGLGLTNESGGSIKIVSEREIEGSRLMGTFCYNMPQSVIPVYFVVRISKPAKIQYWKKLNALKGVKGEWESYSGKYKVYENYHGTMSGDDIGAAFSFNTAADEEVEISVGVSFVSIEGARANLDTEQKNDSFETLRSQAFEKWNKVLDRVSVLGGNREQKTMFYTALYHTFIHPNIINDVDGQYPAMGSGRPERLSREGNRLSMFSGWDIYRINPSLLSLIYPERARDIVESLMDMYREQGNLPKFEIGSREFNVMQGDPAIPFIVNCYFNGVLKGMDVEEIYTAMRQNAFTEGSRNPIRPDNDFYAKNGYIPFLTPYDNSVSQALEYYIADWSLALMAKKLGRTADYNELMTRAMGYKKYFDPNYNLLRPLLSDGKFMEGFDPMQGKNFAPVHGFHEGTSWNYSFYIPFDIPGLIKMHGGGKKFVSNLEKCFEEGLFDMANEPDMGYPYYFSYVAGEQWRTQKYVHQLLNKYFNASPGGLPGNDDTGTMSAWCAWSMLGLYPPTPGASEYIITTPVFNKVTIKLNPDFYSARELVITNANASNDNIYIKSIQAGKRNIPVTKPFISHEELVNAGTLAISTTNKK